MNSGTGIGTREQFLLVELLRRCDSILQTFSACSSVSEAVGDGALCAIRDFGDDIGAGVQ
jgi:hypothetical protein